MGLDVAEANRVGLTFFQAITAGFEDVSIEEVKITPETLEASFTGMRLDEKAVRRMAMAIGRINVISVNENGLSARFE